MRKDLWNESVFLANYKQRVTEMLCNAALLSCERRCVADVLTDTVHCTDSPCQVGDTNSTELPYSRQPLLILNSRQCDLSHM